MKVPKKTKLKKVYWLLAGLAAVFVSLVLLLLYKPAGYNPPKAVYDKQVSPYLTHVLSPQLYNGAQRQEPFELIVTQEGINDIIARFEWPKELDGIRFSAPVVFFVPARIVLMGTVVVGGVELVVTAELNPELDQDGLLNLRVAKVKVGAVNITPLARMIARRIYLEQLGSSDINTEDIQAKLAGSLLNNKPFEPIFEIEDKKVRVKKITITQKKLTIRLVPVSD